VFDRVPNTEADASAPVNARSDIPRDKPRELGIDLSRGDILK
jgi:hypothetical protein